MRSGITSHHQIALLLVWCHLVFLLLLSSASFSAPLLDFFHFLVMIFASHLFFGGAFCWCSTAFGHIKSFRVEVSGSKLDVRNLESAFRRMDCQRNKNKPNY